jgi:hypothetical protein
MVVSVIAIPPTPRIVAMPVVLLFLVVFVVILVVVLVVVVIGIAKWAIVG